MIEFLSTSTRNEDLGLSKRKGKQPTKWEVYEQILRIPYYFVFDGVTNQLRAYELVGNRYRLLELNDSKVWIPSLSIGLGLWQGEYRGCTRQWLRLILTGFPTNDAAQVKDEIMEYVKCSNRSFISGKGKANRWSYFF